MSRIAFLTSTLTLSWWVNTATSNAQSFDILDAGEVTLGTNIIASGIVREYFGMNVTGIGQGTVAIRSGSEVSEKPYEFVLDQTRFVSYLLAHSLGEDLSPAFRRGVNGTIDIEIRDASGAVHDTASVSLEVTRSRKECKKFPSKRVKRCAALNLDKASVADKRRFLNRFVKSLRGPIILEP